MNRKIHSKQNESLKPSLAYGKLCELALEGGMEAQHNVVFRHAPFQQLLGNAACGTVVLNPNFAMFSEPERRDSSRPEFDGAGGEFAGGCGAFGGGVEAANVGSVEG